MDEDAPKGVKGQFGFADLNPKVFYCCCQDATMMIVNLPYKPPKP